MLHAKGPLLSIDLGERETRTEEIDDVLEAFVGGRGVGTKLAHDRVPFEVDPLGPERVHVERDAVVGQLRPDGAAADERLEHVVDLLGLVRAFADVDRT